MSKSYTPGLKILENTKVEKERVLPLKGELHVNVNDNVKSNTIVASTKIPGNVHMVNVANELNIEAKQISECMLLKENDKINTVKTLMALIEHRTFNIGLRSESFNKDVSRISLLVTLNRNNNCPSNLIAFFNVLFTAREYRLRVSLKRFRKILSLQSKNKRSKTN
mgnify:CR=1 FL=1